MVPHFLFGDRHCAFIQQKSLGELYCHRKVTQFGRYVRAALILLVGHFFLWEILLLAGDGSCYNRFFQFWDYGEQFTATSCDIFSTHWTRSLALWVTLVSCMLTIRCCVWYDYLQGYLGLSHDIGRQQKMLNWCWHKSWAEWYTKLHQLWSAQYNVLGCFHA